MTAHPLIDAVSSGAQRPFWSVMIPTYNPNLDYLEQALASVVAHDPGPDTMEIVVIDDCSDLVDPNECVKNAAPGRVTLVRQERRQGLARNWNACVARARGHWVHLLHQDDRVRPGFYDQLRKGIESSPQVGAAFCRDEVIDQTGTAKWPQPLIRRTAGVLEDWIEHFFVGLHLRAPAIVVKRSTYEQIGGFSLDLEYAFDWDMWKRIAAGYPIWYEPTVLAHYRYHDGSASSAFLRSGQNIAEIRRSIDLSGRLLQPALAEDVARRARATYTRCAVVWAWRALLAREPMTSLAQIREARKLTSTFSVAMMIARMIPRLRSIPR